MNPNYLTEDMKLSPWCYGQKQNPLCSNCLLNIGPLDGIVWKQSSYKWLSYEDSKMFQSGLSD